FAHHISTDGVSVSASIVVTSKSPDPATAEERKQQKERSRKPTNLDSSVESNRIVGVDPGKAEIVCMTNKCAPRSEGKTLRYTAAQRRFKSKSDIRNKQLERMKTKRIHALEDQLSQHNSRTPDLEKFKAYLSTRFKVQEE